MNGQLKDERCNRNECTGIIREHQSESGCSCHINPPCSYCTTAREYCPECGWDARDEQTEEQEKDHKQFVLSGAQQSYNSKMEAEEKRRKDFLQLYASNEPVDKIDWVNESHTHFSMIKRGVYPESLEMSDVRKKIDGTFGGRFTRFGKGRFEFIAYTD